MRPGKGPFVALLLVAVVANLPFLHHTWQQWRLDRDLWNQPYPSE